MTSNDDRQLVHRDDLPPGVIEAMEQAFPGFKCAGDIPEGQMPPGMAEAINALHARFERSIMNGTCLDCGAKMPGYPKGSSDEEWERFQRPEGWKMMSQLNGDPCGFECPDCNGVSDE